MNELIEFFSRLFSTSEWPARWECGYWSDFHGWLYIISELMIWAAYFLIPYLILNYLYKKKTALKFNKAYIYFAGFILLCGSTHFIDAFMFWVPMYRLNALLRLATACVSLFTVYHLVRILPEIFKQKTNLELENEILKREEAERKLGEANKSLEAFAYVASHDLQEPLRKVTTYTSLLMARNQDSLDDSGKNLAQKVLMASERMRTMISDVLSLSSLTDERHLLPIKTENAVRSAVEHLEMKILDKGATIRIGKLPSVFGNEAYLSQLFLNLISNSLKFSKQPPLINITGEIIRNQIIIKVSDNGIGMKTEDLDKIFTAFKRLHSKSEYEGTGIGLAICKRIVEIHEGSISAESELGKGTIFTLVFPRQNQLVD
ncbi:MAG: two-component sensor histidine kinase [Verrucomicrobia bacterium]|nr:two-component sensor histidine kinase [Prolixibacteraceae bacterium]